tara:strand:- start:10471 stop:11097 length:627 start_codon:yes stop_codon:yes gene_type:complete
MKNILITIFLISFFSCSSPTEQPSNIVLKPKAIIPAKKQAYKLKEVFVKWTAFKHMTKAQVGGKFDSVFVEGFKESPMIKEAISGITFKIPVNSTNTGDKVRDYKIVNSFFNTLSNTDFITGSITSIESNGTGVLTLKMNEMEIQKNFKWEFDDSNRDFFLKTSIDVLNWNAKGALDALNDVCLEQHTGPDGTNKLWPNVDIVVFASL